MMGLDIQLFFAKAIDEDRTAMVIKYHGQLQVGVAYLTNYRFEYTQVKPSSAVERMADFVANRGWENGPPRQIEQTKALPAPRVIGLGDAVDGGAVTYDLPNEDDDND